MAGGEPEHRGRMGIAPDLLGWLENIGWSQRHLAEVLAIHETTVRRWAKDPRLVPAPIATWLRRLDAAHRRHPAPSAPERTPGPGRQRGGTRYATLQPEPQSMRPEMQFWFVTVEKIATGKQQSRRIKAATPEDAGRQTCDLIGGPGSEAYRIVACAAG